MSAEPRDRSRAAQLKLMLRQQEDLDVVLLLVAWYAWRERVAWLQTSLWWKRTSGRDCFLQEVLQHWRSAVPLKRQEAIDEQLMSLRGSMVQDAKAMDRVAEKVEEHGTKVLHQLQEALQKKDAQTSRQKVFHAWQQCAASRHQNFGHVRRARHLLCRRRAFGAWRQALENREQRGAARLFLKFKLLHQGSWQKEQLHVMLLRWFSLVQRPRRRFGAERPWQRAWQLLAAQQILATDQRLLLSHVLHAWRPVKTSARGSEKLKTLQKRYKANENERRKVQGCRQLYDLLVKADVSCHLLAHCMNAWKETRLRRTVDEGMEVSLQSILTAASSSLSSEMRALSDRIQSSQRSERRHQVAAGLRRLEDFWAEWLKRRQLLSGALDGWRQCNAGVSLEKTTLRAEQQQERLSELEGQVEPMRNLLRESRRFLSSYLCGRCGRWRRDLLREVLRLWHISIRFVRDAMRDKVLQLRRKLEADGRGVGFAMLGALALASDRSEHIKHFLLEAWLRVAEQEKHQREVEVLAGHLHSDSTRSCKKVSSILLEWMQQHGSNGAWFLRDVLRGWATVVSSSMQKKIQHFRKLQAHAEITKLCVSTGDWIDQLWLREVLALWHRQALQEILTRHAAEEERSRKLQVRLKAHYRIIELIRGKSTERQTALALAHVCLGAWSMSAAMENARKLTDKARQNSLGHRSHGRRMLSDAQDLAGAVLAFCFRQSLSGLQKSAAWPLVKRCFPLWRREASLSSARRQILAQEAANLQITEEMRLQTERYQQRCSRWAVVQMIQHQKMRYLEEAFFLWCNQKPQWRHRLSHQKHLELADVVLMKGAQQQQVFFVAWKRVQAEEKVMRSEEEMWQLEARLARLAGERGLSMRALEERLSLEGTDFRGVPWRH